MPYSSFPLSLWMGTGFFLERASVPVTRRALFSLQVRGRKLLS